MRSKDLRFMAFESQDLPVFIVKHHPTVIKCWKKSLTEGLIKKNAVLFHIDRHPDFSFNKENELKSQELLELSDDDLDVFIQQDLALDNSEFIVNAMLSGIISDTISIHYDVVSSCYGTKQLGGYGTTDKYFFSHEGIEHNYYIDEVEDISGLFGYQSLLEDICIHHDTKNLFKQTTNLILDIDLDFFTYSNNGTYPKHKLDIKNQICSESFNRVVSKANIVTIALEPHYCGSEENCAEILDVFCEWFSLDIDPERIKAYFLNSG